MGGRLTFETSRQSGQGAVRRGRWHVVVVTASPVRLRAVEMHSFPRRHGFEAKVRG